MKEKIIPLNTFTPRDYQLPFVNAFENNEYSRYVLCWARRCLAGDTHITMADGSWKFLKDIEVGDKILSWDGSKIVEDIVEEVWNAGTKETKRVKSHGFLSLITSKDHRFMTYNCYNGKESWMRAEDLKRGRQVLNYAGYRSCDVHDPDLAEFIGYIAADGYCSGYQQPKFTNINMDILKRVEYLTKKIFNYDVIWRKKGNCYDLGMSNGTKGGGATKNKVKELFRDSGQDVPKSRSRLLPILWKMDRQSLLRFFAAYISSDGCISLVSHKLCNKEIIRTAEISFNCGKSYELCWDIYWLLRKIGISTSNPRLDKGSNWKIRIYKSVFIRQLLSNNIIYGKQDRQKEVLDILEYSSAKMDCYKGCYKLKGNVYDDNPQPLYDIRTKKHHNFIANGYIVHNSGKDVCAFNLIFRAAMRSVGVYFYVLPSYKQCKKVIWDSINNDGQRFLDYIPKEAVLRKNSQEQKITLINGSIIQLIGSSNIDSIVGSNPRGAVFSEYAIQDESCYQFLRPIFLANGGWMVFISTPRAKNGFYDLFQAALSHPKEWFSSYLTVEDTGHISVEAIQKEIDEGLMSWDIAQQEYFCSWSIGASGTYYLHHIEKMRRENRIDDILYDPSLPVHTAWDLGLNDPTVVIFFQVTIGNSIRIIDYYEKSDDSTEAHIKVVKEKPYIYGVHIAPHDIKHREQTTNVTRWEKAHALGLTFRQAPGTKEGVWVDDGIEAVRTILSRVYIDQVRCKDLIKHLENYRQEYDDKKKTYNPKPYHDHHSHGADAMRYLATSLHLLEKGMTQEDVDKAKARARQNRGSTLPRALR